MALWFCASNKPSWSLLKHQSYNISIVTPLSAPQHYALFLSLQVLRFLFLAWTWMCGISMGKHSGERQMRHKAFLKLPVTISCCLCVSKHGLVKWYRCFWIIDTGTSGISHTWLSLTLSPLGHLEHDTKHNRNDTLTWKHGFRSYCVYFKFYWI